MTTMAALDELALAMPKTTKECPRTGARHTSRVARDWLAERGLGED
jgi:hypothetical protein